MVIQTGSDSAFFHTTTLQIKRSILCFVPIAPVAKTKKKPELCEECELFFGSGQWAVGSGQWAVGSGQWAVASIARLLSKQQNQKQPAQILLPTEN